MRYIRGVQTAVGKLQEQAGDSNDKHWREEWAIAMQRFLTIAMKEETKADTIDKLASFLPS